MPAASHEEMMMKTVAEVIKQLIKAEETGQEININKLVIVVHCSIFKLFIHFSAEFL